MNKILCVLFVLCGFQPAAALERQAFIFTDYDLKIKVTPATQSFEAEGKVTLRNDTAQPQRNPVLQISSTLEWNSITVGGKPAQYLSQAYASDIDHTGALSEAVLTLPQPVLPRATVELEITYSGKIPQDNTRLTRIGVPAERSANSDWDRISESFTGVRGIGHVAWYPVATEAASLSDGDQVFERIMAWTERQSRSRMRLSFCWPGEMRLVANGQTAAAAMQPAGLSCQALQYDPIGMAVPAFVIGSYRALNQPPMTVQYIAGHESYARAWATAGERVAPFVAQWFGPRKRPVRIVELPDKDMYPYEGGGVLFTPLVSGEEKDIQVVLAHQLAHASFQSPRLWMDEGLAHFAQALVRQQQEGRKAALAYMDERLAPLQEAEMEFLPPAPGTASASPPTGQPLVSATDEVFFRTKAMFVWWMLRDMVGDDALERAIRAYRPDQDKEPSYFQRLLAEQLHRDLEWFFDDWVYRDRGLPEFQITAVHPRKLIPQDWSVTVTVENSGNAGAEVPVAVRAAQGEERKRLEVHAHEKAVVRIPIPATPQQAVVNDGSVPEFDMNNNTAEIPVTESPK
ncbi:MAG TPA: hypothetical protein VMT05_02295 [Terriglobales bacterium]|nr:hypothetical protein [Terriglobales bacterium]